MFLKLGAKWGAVGLAVALACFLSYELGKSKAKIQIVEKEVEIIRYEEKKREQIYVRPHASRDTLLKRMYEGKF